jgi:hypothetical protein
MELGRSKGRASNNGNRGRGTGYRQCDSSTMHWGWGGGGGDSLLQCLPAKCASVVRNQMVKATLHKVKRCRVVLVQ